METTKRLELSRSVTSLDELYEVPGLNPTVHFNELALDRSILCCTGLPIWVATFLQYVVERNTQCGSFHTLLEDAYGMRAGLAMRQSIAKYKNNHRSLYKRWADRKAKYIGAQSSEAATKLGVVFSHFQRVD